MARFFLNVFSADRPVPKATDIAVSFAFHLRELSANDEMVPSVSYAQIRNFASFLRRRWLEEIQASFILRAIFKETRDQAVSRFLLIDAACPEEFDQTLNSAEQLARSYFQSFSVGDATNFVYVWLADENHYVHHDDRAVIVKVQVNAARGCDVGFFLSSHDYSMSDRPPLKRLFLCFEDVRSGCECGQFEGELFIGKQTDSVLWLR
jgi:hypothetical protein